MCNHHNHELDLMRHSCAHLIAAAVKELYPEAKFGVGPAVENGFYYDIKFPVNISDSDLEKISLKAEELKNKDLAFEKSEMTIDEAIKFFAEAHQNYKVELLNDIKTKGTTMVGEEAGAKDGKSEKVTIYTLGNFADLCRGPHLASTGKIGAFKLTKLAGAYWRGDEKNDQLQRVYGLCFEDKKDLENYLHILEEAEKRDHRKLGKDLDLFVFSEVVGKGLPLWTAKGTTIRRELERFIVDEELARGYTHVCTPDIAKLDLYKKSGHYPYYKDSMYAPIEIDGEEFMLRPMSCPHHFELYLSKPRSYRELPMRIAELAKLYRYEQSGELSGLMRVRGFCLADSHIICADSKQAGEEVNGALDLIEFIAGVFGLKMGENFSYRLSLGDRADGGKYYKDDAAWEEAEGVLRKILESRKCPFVEAQGEAAFYGPKIDVQMKNVLGKEDTAFTVQYDFVMPERFNLTYVDKNNEEKKAIVIHRSSVGALERIVAFLIEHYAGNFPVWLSPVQVKLIPVADSHIEGAEHIALEMKKVGVRVEVDKANETLGNRVRKATQEKAPYIIVVGDKEVGGEDFMVRVRGQEKQEKISPDKFMEKIVSEIKERKV